MVLPQFTSGLNRRETQRWGTWRGAPTSLVGNPEGDPRNPYVPPPQCCRMSPRRALIGWIFFRSGVCLPQAQAQRPPQPGSGRAESCGSRTRRRPASTPPYSRPRLDLSARLRAGASAAAPSAAGAGLGRPRPACHGCGGPPASARARPLPAARPPGAGCAAENCGLRAPGAAAEVRKSPRGEPAPQLPAPGPALWPRPPAARLPPRASLVARSLGRGRRDGTPHPGPCAPLSRETPSPAPPPATALRPRLWEPSRRPLRKTGSPRLEAPGRLGGDHHGQRGRQRRAARGPHRLAPEAASRSQATDAGGWRAGGEVHAGLGECDPVRTRSLG